ncbi:ribbon-helix-helix protein, CopG family [Homoserinimonas sp. A447]
MTNESYEQYAARLTDQETPLVGSGSPLRGEAAAAAGRSFLVEAYGSEAAVKRAMRRGRPRVGQATGASPEVRGRIMPAEFDALEELRKQTGRSRSDLVREGIHLLLQKNKIGA